MFDSAMFQGIHGKVEQMKRVYECATIGAGLGIMRSKAN